MKRFYAPAQGSFLGRLAHGRPRRMTAGATQLRRRDKAFVQTISLRGPNLDTNSPRAEELPKLKTRDFA